MHSRGCHTPVFRKRYINGLVTHLWNVIFSNLVLLFLVLPHIKQLGIFELTPE